MAKISERRQKRHSLGALLVVAIILIIILVISVPKSHYMEPNELATVGELQFINGMQLRYKSEFQRFAASLTELGPTPSGEPGPQAADLIPAALASGDKDGYRFVMAATTSGYTVNANPKVFKTSGYRTFYTGQNGIIRQNLSAEPASASSPEFK